MMPLTMAQAGTQVRLIAVEAGRGLQARLAAMGLVPGTEIDVISNGLRGPFIIGVKGSRIVLGRGMAQQMRVA